MRDSFSHVSDWVFDLDNTLYPPSDRLFDQIAVKMTDYVMRTLNVAQREADHLRDQYWSLYGTTLAGLMHEHSIDPVPFLQEVHEISLDHMSIDPALVGAIRNLPGRKIVYTNGTAPYAQRVLEARGMVGLFDQIYGVEDANFQPKPNEEAYRMIFAKAGLDPSRAAMFEDDPRNLRAPHAMGLQTVLVTPDAPIQTPHAAYIHYQTHDLAEFLTQII